MILVLQWVSVRVSSDKTSAQTRLPKSKQDFTKRPHTATLERLQASKIMPALQVYHSLAAKSTLRRLKPAKFCWPFSNYRTTATLPA